jgi:hypothetical protein
VKTEPRPGTWEHGVELARPRHDEPYAGRIATDEERERVRRWEALQPQPTP